MRLTTSDGATVVTHRVPAPPGADAAPPIASVLYAHATGFHGRCWSPVGDALGLPGEAVDLRGFGASTPPPGWDVDWHGFAADAVATGLALRAAGSPPLIGVGHSMGGAALVMAALAEPDLFAGLVLFEPIVVPPSPTLGTGNPLAEGARRRRATFPSYDAALANFAAKPPMNTFTPAALEAYVRFGLREGGDGQVHLCCTPEHEARTYETGGTHGTFERLGDLRVPTLYLSGRVERHQPSAFVAALADATPGAAYHRLDHVDHFGPMQDPVAVAAEIATFAAAIRA